MPRQARFDLTGHLYHVIARGIERSPIFKESGDCSNFLRRLGPLLKETECPCYAWVLMPNHFHLLLRSGCGSISTLMLRLLTGHALYFNRTYGRVGHLFANRFKSIICEDDPYFLELVRYIHLNPLRGGLVSSFAELVGYPWSGHRDLLGLARHDWQESIEVLRRFGDNESQARKSYTAFLVGGLGSGHRADLEGGSWGLGGRDNRDGPLRVGRDMSASLLGSREFTERILEHKTKMGVDSSHRQLRRFSVDEVLELVAQDFGVDRRDLRLPGRRAIVSQAKAVSIHLCVDILGRTCAEMARLIGMSPVGAGKARLRGRMHVRSRGLREKLRRGAIAITAQDVSPDL